MLGFAVIALGGVAVLAGLAAWTVHLTRHPQKRGPASAGSGLLTAAFDELFHPTAMDARDEQDREQRLVVPAPTPDQDLGMAEGRIRLDLDESENPPARVMMRTHRPQ